MMLLIQVPSKGQKEGDSPVPYQVHWVEGGEAKSLYNP